MFLLELVYSFFEFLVTMKWWDDLWLNEGFATFIEFKGTAHNHPDWDMVIYMYTFILYLTYIKYILNRNKF